MKRRDFILLSTAASIATGLSLKACSSKEQLADNSSSAYLKLISALLKEWTDALISVQINQPDNPELDGALYCPACDKIHGRCMDAVYPFMHMAAKTGEARYLDAAISVMKWSKNVSRPDGSWTVIPNPKSWRGITVFGAIALGEALHHHSHLLPAEIKKEWMNRLAKAADFIFKNFSMTYSHVNYGFTAVYALNFLGRLLDKREYIARSRELAKEIPNWLTEPNYLIFGEDKPADKRSKKGLSSVDLGYNVEESLNGLVQYALLEEDEDLLQLLSKSMEGHLEFMLPDGAWDNSWGTRQNKWTYWGSRTTDGCQPAFGLMAGRNPAFGTAAYLNTELLQRCTVNGLLAGGLHYGTHQVQPCIHHTFAHAKSLAYLLDSAEKLPEINKSSPLPRSLAKGVKHFPELDVWLASKGPWKATVSAYDNEFKTEYSQQASGGSLAVLWHEKVGPIFTASMARYILVEKNNQQFQPGEEFALTPRLEIYKGDQWFTNLYDLEAKVESEDKGAWIQFTVEANLVSEDQEPSKSDRSAYELWYSLQENSVEIKARKKDNSFLDNSLRLVLPLISPNTDTVLQTSPNEIRIEKPEGTLVVEAKTALRIKNMDGDRIFNMVPGMEVLPVILEVAEKDLKEVSCSIHVE